jgi:hypothetical protein
MLRYEEKWNIFFAAKAKLLQEAISMSVENEKNETKDMLAKIDDQLQKHMKSLEKAEKGLKSAQQKIRTCKKMISDIERMRSAVIGERVVAMGFDTPQELERLEEIARAKKTSEDASQETHSTEMNTSPESHEGAMM